MSEKKEDIEAAVSHMAGEGCLVTYQYGNRCSVHLLSEGSIEAEAWQEAAFTNGSPLVKITIEYDPKRAAELAAFDAARK